MWIQRITLFMLFAVTTFEYLVKGDKWGRGAILPHVAAYTPEILGALAALIVIIMGTQTRFKFVRPAYWLLGIAALLVMASGVLVNSVDVGPTFAGIRTYLRGLPWFFVPAVFAFSDQHIRQQLKLLLIIGCVQLPIAAEQRMRTNDGSTGVAVVTGDWTVGTLGDSGTLSIFLACLICVAAALYIRKTIDLKRFIIIFAVLLVPTLINETKGTLIFLPIGLLLVFTYAANPGKRLKYIFTALMFVTLFVSIYIPVYDALGKDREYAVPLTEFLTDQRRLERYFVTDKGVGSEGEVGRGDALMVPFYFLAKEPIHLAFGLGMGNAAESALGQQFNGAYAPLLAQFLITGFTRIALELGFLGVLLVIVFFWAVYKDARYVARMNSELKGTVAAGLIGATAVIWLGMFYNDVTITPSVSYLFFYYSGLIAADRMRVALEVREAQANAARLLRQAPQRAPLTPAR